MGSGVRVRFRLPDTEIAGQSENAAAAMTLIIVLLAKREVKHT